MWQYQALIALDLALDRDREARAAARREELARALRPDAGTSAHPSAFRAIVAAPVRGLGWVAGTLSDAACTAATRIEGRVA